MNKETLQNYNTKLNANNTSLNDILETINGMSEIKLGEKTITKNGVYNATDDDLDGYSSVDVQTSGADLNEYFNTENGSAFTSNYNILSNTVKKIPNISIAPNITDYSYMFSKCRTLEEIPFLDTSNATKMNYAFQYCNKIKTIPLLNTSNVTLMNNIFAECTSLETIPLIDTSKVTNFNAFFSRCSALKEVPLLDTSSADIIDNMFTYCTSLETIPLIDTSKATSMTQMCNGDSKLKNFPAINTSNVIKMDTVFQGCTSLVDLPELDCSKVEKIGYVLNSCTKLTNFGGFKNIGMAYKTTQNANYYEYTLTLSSSSYLTHDSLMNVINNLYDIASAGVKTQKLVLGYSNLNKLTEEEKAIATNKGWTLS